MRLIRCRVNSSEYSDAQCLDEYIIPKLSSCSPCDEGAAAWMPMIMASVFDSSKVEPGAVTLQKAFLKVLLQQVADSPDDLIHGQNKDATKSWVRHSTSCIEMIQCVAHS